MSRILSAADAEILSELEGAIEKAIKSSEKEIIKGLQLKVIDQAVNQYYNDYKPSIYRRSNRIGDAFKMTHILVNGNLSVNINANSDRLPQYESKSPRHKSGGEWISRFDSNFDPEGDDNGMPEKEWIFENFMNGVHPRYFFVKNLGFVNDSAYFMPTHVRVSQNIERFYKHDLKFILTKHLKQQLK